MPLLTLVLPNLWHQLPLLKGLVPVGTEDTSPRSIPRSGSPKTTPRALWTGGGGSPFRPWPLCQPESDCSQNLSAQSCPPLKQSGCLGFSLQQTKATGFDCGWRLFIYQPTCPCGKNRFQTLLWLRRMGPWAGRECTTGPRRCFQRCSRCPRPAGLMLQIVAGEQGHPCQ